LELTINDLDMSRINDWRHRNAINDSIAQDGMKSTVAVEVDVTGLILNSITTVQISISSTGHRLDSAAGGLGLTEISFDDLTEILVYLTAQFNDSTVCNDSTVQGCTESSWLTVGDG